MDVFTALRVCLKFRGSKLRVILTLVHAQKALTHGSEMIESFYLDEGGVVCQCEEQRADHASK